LAEVDADQRLIAIEHGKQDERPCRPASRPLLLEGEGPTIGL